LATDLPIRKEKRRSLVRDPHPESRIGLADVGKIEGGTLGSLP